MTEVVVVSGGDNPPEPASVETAPEAAVAIAEIEAGRDIALAEIQSETAETLAETEADANADAEDLETWIENQFEKWAALWGERLDSLGQASIRLSEEMATLKTMVLSILTPPSPVPPPVPEPAAEPATAVSPETATAVSEPAPEESRARRRWM